MSNVAPLETQPQTHARRPSREIKDMMQSDFVSAKIVKEAIEEEDELESPSEVNRSALPEQHSPLISPLKAERVLGPNNFARKPFGPGVHEPAETDQASAWAFSEEELPNFPNDTNSLRILMITWNLHGKKPKDGLDKLFNTEKTKHHIISVGTEECLRSIPASTLYESKSYWINLLRNYLDKDYIMLKSHSMNALHLTLFVHRSIFPLVRGIESAEVRTGIGKIVGNKGGIGITFRICGTSLLFINCHLASGQKQARQRNDDFERIMNELELPKARVAQEKKMKQKSNVVDRFDFVFWSGDFNYRVNETRDNTIEYIRENKCDVLLKEDQLTIAKKTNKIFAKFEEGEIKFPPTYKYQTGTHLFDVKKKRTPSWTDRVLFASNKKSKDIKQMTYLSQQENTMSDHRPVFAQFVLTVEGADKKTEEEGLVKVKTNACNLF